jgi:hypothetical protein
MIFSPKEVRRMSHSQRKATLEGVARVVTKRNPKVVRRTDPLLSQLSTQSREILGIIGLGAVGLDNHSLADLELKLKTVLNETGATYLVPTTMADAVVGIAQQRHPDSVVMRDTIVSVTVFGKLVKLTPISVRDLV